jgi:hypothetical protein
MEEARQHSAVTEQLRLVTTLSIVSLAAFLGGIVAFLVVGGVGLLIGVAIFLWLRVGVEIARSRLAKRDSGAFRWQIANVALHVMLAGFCTYAFAPYLSDWTL